MTRTEDWNPLESAPRWILAVTGTYLCLGAIAMYVCSHAAPAFSVQAAPGGAEALSVIGMAAAQAWLCVLALRAFEAGAPLRRAWLLIALSAATHVAGGLFSQAAALPNSLALGGAERIHRAALLLSGPAQMALLAAGLLVALRMLWKLGFRVRPRATGWAMAGILVLFTLTRFAATAAGQLTADTAISLVRSLLLCVLSVEALFLWLSAAGMGKGPIAKCWRAFAIGIFVIGFGEAAMWAIGSYVPGWLVAALEWYVWFPAVAVFALAPAHTVAAVRRATGRTSTAPSRLPAGAFPRTAPAN
ncbi:MAG TPA: hypothetical protein VN893_15785 [Bryobacteraceae bacterium]|nr:hypothetical protein [Bryobacteraceae bacterium]